jgi:hypothetical protein
MAEVKNSFLQSKMNKDLDDRLIPKGEYRDALNISVGKSEDKDVGALESILGNELSSDTGNSNLTCIGCCVDNQNNRIFQFWTDYEDVNNTLSIPDSADMRITVYSESSSSLTTLVSGVFLNFAKNSQYRICGANVLEDLLFFSDDRNQPRKINISRAISDPSYYTEETQISVAKYYPVNPISVYLSKNVTTTSASTSTTSTEVSFTVSVEEAKELNVGMQLISDLTTPVLGINDYAIITSINTLSGLITLTVPSSTTITLGTVLSFFGTSMTNKADEPNWPGDPNFLKDKYVRFSYRFKFDDGEYSLMAPFTQILYIPNQNGYFVNGDENAAYRSTVLSWMENYVNNIDLYIELPDTGNNIGNSYKITDIDILYKESDSLAVNVLETVSVNQISDTAGDTNIYKYTYTSQKPYKTLPESQTTRVYDKVPIRARAQEIVGNRVVYGNFVTQNQPPSSINYSLTVTEKTNSFTSWAEYPNHTLKQNRNYQAGIVVADKFGRQSAVILSSNDTNQSVGSTIYSTYYPSGSNLNVKEWRGDTLVMIVNTPILPNSSNLYAIVDGIYNGTDGFEISAGVVSGSSFIFTLAPGASQINTPKIGGFLRGKYKDYVKVLPSSSLGFVYTDGDISDIYNYTGEPLDVKYSYKINPLGWYSYKIVVRQQQQEYYNVYLPGILNGYPDNQTFSTGNVTVFPLDEIDKTAHTVLLNDNINKIPRDLTEVGPDQRQYRSSVELFGRVENTLESTITSNKQYYPARKADVASTIASSSDLNFLPTDTTDNPYGSASINLYQLNTTPIIARISTVSKIGVKGTTASSSTVPTASDSMIPFLSVYETAPVVSLLDLFWETSTSGLISDLNYDILNGSSAAVGFDGLEFNHNEFQNYLGTGTPLESGDQSSPYITGYFKPKNASGIPLDVDSMTMTVVDLTGVNRTSNFKLEKETTGIYTDYYSIKILNNFVFLKDSNVKESYVFTFNILDAVNGDAVISVSNSLNNSVPLISFPAEEDPIEVFSITNAILGPALSCVGTNGSLDASNNNQELQWSIVDSASSPDWELYFSINPTTGVISLINDSVSIGVDYNLTIRATDAFNFTDNTPTTNSLTTDREIIIYYEVSENFCGDWTCILTRPGGFVNWTNDTNGLFNFWKLMLPGETIDVANSSVNITSYSVGPDGTFVYEFLVPQPLTFSSSDFNGNFSFSMFQGDDENPTYEIFFSGNIRTSSGRNITIDFSDIAQLPVSLHGSSNDTCALYIPTTNKSWKLTNTNTSSVIRWKALTSSGSTIIGGDLNPGENISSLDYFGGTYTCIKENSLTFGDGGVVEYQIC